MKDSGTIYNDGQSKFKNMGNWTFNVLIRYDDTTN